MMTVYVKLNCNSDFNRSELLKKKVVGGGGTSQVALMLKNPPANAGDVRDSGLIPGLGRYPGGGYGNTLQDSCLENPHGQRSLVGCRP